MLNIKVLGPGCANCRKLDAIVHEAVAATGVQAEVVKVTDMGEIVAYDVLKTPGLVITRSWCRRGASRPRRRSRSGSARRGRQASRPACRGLPTALFAAKPSQPVSDVGHLVHAHRVGHVVGPPRRREAERLQ